MKSLMPSKKTWTSDDGVIEIEMISYRTVMVERMRDKFRALQDENKDLPNEAAVFVLCLASTTQVRLLVDEPPLWAEIIQQVFDTGEWRKDPVKVYDDLAYAPSQAIARWWEAYTATRDDSLLAPEPLQDPAPLPPEAYILEGEEDQDKINFTESDTTNGGGNLTVMSSVARGKPSTGPMRKAK